MKRLLFVISMSFVLSSCTKTNGCEYIEEGRFLTGIFHYSNKSVKISKWPNQTEYLDVNAYLVRDYSQGDFYDTIVITKSSVPIEYRNEGDSHVAVSLKNTVTGATTTEVRRDFYKLLCIEKIK